MLDVARLRLGEVGVPCLVNSPAIALNNGVVADRLTLVVVIFPVDGLPLTLGRVGLGKGDQGKGDQVNCARVSGAPG